LESSSRIIILLDYATLKTAIAGATDLNMCCFCFIYWACGKSAQIPLYTWLPDAMEDLHQFQHYSCCMVTAGIFMITRLNFVFDLARTFKNIIACRELLPLVAATISGSNRH
jgi:NADH-quinone oxidoreductase subunit L